MSHPNNTGAPNNIFAQGSIVLVVLVLVAVLVLAILALVIWVIKHPRTIILADDVSGLDDAGVVLNQSDENIRKEPATITEIRDSVLAENPDLTDLKALDIKVLTRVILEHGGSILQKDLAKECNFSKAKLSRLLKEMEEQGLITRKPIGQSLLITLV